METRKIRDNEKALITFLLESLNLDLADYPISEDVFEYEGGKMGSISLNNKPDSYVGDIDTDGIPVVITLTEDDNGQLLDLDFWKNDMSKLLKYPSVDEVVILNGEEE